MLKNLERVSVLVRTCADYLALTQAERRVLQFLIAGCVLGIGVQVLREQVDSPAKFDYSVTDSAFAALSAASPVDDDAPRGDPAQAGPVRVNSATKAELMSLPGVGEVMAERIMLERQDHGVFRSLEDLARVRGIGPKRIELLRPLVIID